MFWTLLALISLVVLGGFLAYYGDLQGRRWGKKRVSWFGLRPKHTAILITSLTGALIALLSIFTVLAAAPAIREVVLRGEQAIRDNKRLNTSLITDRIAFENELKEVRSKLRLLEGQQTESERELVRLNNDSRAKKAEIEEKRRNIQELRITKTQLERRQIELEGNLKREQASLAIASATNRKLSKSNKELRDYNDNARDFNKLLGNQNVALSRTNLELEQKNKTLQGENGTLAQNNADLKREGVELTRTNEALFRVNQNLIQDTEDKRQKLAALEAKVQELTENEKALYTQLASTGQSFTQFYTALRQGRLILRAGGELARRTIPAHLRPEAVRRELLALLEDASASAQRLGALRGENGRAVAIVRKRVVTLVGVEDTDEADSLNALIENLTGNDKDIVVLANAINNSVAGEQVRIELTPRPSVPLFKKGEVVASRIINARQPVEEIADNLVEFLQKDVRDAAMRAGTIPQIEPETGTEQFGVAVPRDLVLLTDRVRRTGGRVRMEAVASEPLTSADLLKLTFRISRAE